MVHKKKKRMQTKGTKMITCRDFTFYYDQPIPTIKIAKQQGQQMCRSSNKGNARQMVVRDRMWINNSGLNEGCPIFERVMKELQQRKILQKEIADGGDDDDHNDDDDEKQHSVIVDRQWRQISLTYCGGRLDIVISEIFKCHIESLVICVSSADPRNDMYWPALVNGLKTCTTLTSLRLSDMTFTTKHVKILQQGLACQMDSNSNNKEKQNNTDSAVTNVRYLSLIRCSFARGSHSAVADVLYRYFAPSLTSFRFLSKLLKDTKRAEFLSRFLLGHLSTIETESENSICTTTATTTTTFPDTFDDLEIHLNGDGQIETMSFLAKWLLLRQERRQGYFRNDNKPFAGVGDIGRNSMVSSPGGRNPQFDESTDSVTNNNPIPTFPKPNYCCRSLTIHSVARTTQHRGVVRTEEQRRRTEQTGPEKCFRDDFILSLGKCKIEYFHFYFLSLSEEDFSKLMTSVSKNVQYLKGINFSRNNLSGHSHIMANFFNSIRDVSNSSSSSSSLPSSLPSPMSSMPYEGCFLLNLDLSNCHLADECLIALSRQFSTHGLPNLKALNLSGEQDFTQQCVEQIFLPSLKKTIELENLAIMVVQDDIIETEMKFICNRNRGGYRCIMYNDQETTTTTTTTTTKKKYDAKLWPTILNRVFHCIRLHDSLYEPTYAWHCTTDRVLYHNIDQTENNDEVFDGNTDSCRQRVSVAYYLLVNGGMIDCCNEAIGTTYSNSQETKDMNNVKGRKKKNITQTMDTTTLNTTKRRRRRL